MPNNWEPNIFKQKGLWEVYKKSQKVLPISNFNAWVFKLTIIMLAIVFIWGLFDWFCGYSVSDALSFLRFITNQGLTISIGILGFLIAGFAIFSSITKIDVFSILSKTQYKNTDISNLQYVFFNFINVFTLYLGFLTFCVFISLLFSDSSPIITMFINTMVYCNNYAIGFIFLLSSIGICWMVVAILRLKSFIWNLYQIILVTITTEEMLQEINKKKIKKRASTKKNYPKKKSRKRKVAKKGRGLSS